ncbi:MAG: hypothetical protein IKI40_08420 [Treponema sp.]|nr:hypothetical protein [Treponema sp.]MBR7080528.1 hypothetical protein [Treponema sp.]
MACFLAPLAEAIVISAIKGLVGNKKSAADVVAESKDTGKTVSIKQKLGWLQNMLYGGSALLAIEHIYHGEVVLYPPFLTAMRNPADVPEMLHEIATVGVGMAVLVTAVWGIAVGLSSILKGKNQNLIGGKA